MTGIFTSNGLVFEASPMKAHARTTSKVDTPKMRFGSYVPACFYGRLKDKCKISFFSSRDAMKLGGLWGKWAKNDEFRRKS